MNESHHTVYLLDVLKFRLVQSALAIFYELAAYSAGNLALI